ncbi:hypothetical protein BDN72DRAFT_494825 [Pluteus cervinus]|uniref:Uncharacterized protein n=1 Tax=Pluteus cervinus TaxID=181527 RepID=A0ACD3A579_9AGAR|nr:hypothetical protein BDN72DRAFT_494825 [Pluteus cervinus]
METKEMQVLVRGHPEEILIAIFQHAVSSSQFRIQTAVHLGGVSNRWRNLVLGLADLWEWIDCRHPSLMELCIERARARLLSFRASIPLSMSEGRDIAFMGTILHHIHRVQTLDIKSADERGILSVTLYPLRPAPHLITLDIRQCSLPNDMFNVRPPLLQHLALHSCMFEWQSLSHLHHLHHLSIRNPYTLVTASDFLGVLALNPNLKSIDIVSVFHQRGTYTGNPIILPELETLYIYYEYCHDATILLRSLSFPHTAHVHLSLNENHPEDHEEIFETLKQSRIGSTWDAQTIMVVLHDPWFYFKLVEHGNNLQTPLIEIGIASPGGLERLTLKLLTSTHFLRLESLDLDGEDLDSITLIPWITFGNLPKLRILKVRNGFALSFLEFVQMEGRDGYGTPSFPHLRALLYEDYRFDVEGFDAGLLQLAEYLQCRCRMGVSVPSLTVVGLYRMSSEKEVMLAGFIQNLEHMIKRERYGREERVY